MSMIDDLIKSIKKFPANLINNSTFDENLNHQINFVCEQYIWAIHCNYNACFIPNEFIEECEVLNLRF